MRPPRRDAWSPYPPHAPKLPPPEHGIKIRRAGATWWGARWIAALEGLSRELKGRLARGKTYARTGRVHDLEVFAGGARAKVTGTRAEPYAVEIALAPLADASWKAAIDAMAKEARFSAELLAGAMPKDIDAAFQAGGASLFPTRAEDLSTKCSCPDWANPCKHVSAACYVLGEAFDRDPFLLFELRGRRKEAVLDALRRARASVAKANVPKTEKRRPAVRRPKTTEADYDAWRAPPPEASFALSAPSSSGALLKQLGTPPSWRATDPPWKALAPLVRAASERARAMALDASDFVEPFRPSGV